MDDAVEPHLEVTFDRQDLKQRSLKGAAATVISQGVKFVLKFGSTIALARLLSPAEFGIVAMVAPILAFVTTLNDLGYTQAIIQRRDLEPAQISALFWINLSISAGLALLLIAVSPLVGWVYHEPRAVPLLWAMASLVILGTLSMAPQALLLRDMRFIPQVSVDLAAVALSIAVMIGAASLGFSYWSIILGQIAASALTLALVLLLTGWRPQWPRRRVDVGSLVRFGAHLTGVNLAGYFSMTADNMIIGAVAGKIPLGLYDRSYNLVVQPLNQLMAPVSRVALPLLSRLKEDGKLYRETYINMLRVGLSLTMPAMVACVVLAQPLILFLLGDKWRAAAPIFAWICFGGIVAPVFSTTGWVFTTQGRTDRQLKITITTSLISIAAFAIGVRWGAIGVAAVSAISFTFIQTPLMMWGCTRDGWIRLRDMGRALWPLFVADALAAGGLWLSAPYLSGWRVLPGVALSYLVFGTAVLILPGGRELLRTVLRFADVLLPARLRKPA